MKKLKSGFIILICGLALAQPAFSQIDTGPVTTTTEDRTSYMPLLGLLGLLGLMGLKKNRHDHVSSTRAM